MFREKTPLCHFQLHHLRHGVLRSAPRREDGLNLSLGTEQMMETGGWEPPGLSWPSRGAAASWGGPAAGVSGGSAHAERPWGHQTSSCPGSCLLSKEGVDLGGWGW